MGYSTSQTGDTINRESHQHEMIAVNPLFHGRNVGQYAAADSADKIAHADGGQQPCYFRFTDVQILAVWREDDHHVNVSNVRKENSKEKQQKLRICENAEVTHFGSTDRVLYEYDLIWRWRRLQFRVFAGRRLNAVTGVFLVIILNSRLFQRHRPGFPRFLVGQEFTTSNIHISLVLHRRFRFHRRIDLHHFDRFSLCEPCVESGGCEQHTADADVKHQAAQDQQRAPERVFVDEEAHDGRNGELADAAAGHRQAVGQSPPLLEVLTHHDDPRSVDQAIPDTCNNAKHIYFIILQSIYRLYC